MRRRPSRFSKRSTRRAGEPRAPTDVSAERKRSLTLKLAYARAHSTAAADGGGSNEDAKTAQQHIKAVAEYEKLLAPRQARTGRPAVAGRVSITATKRQLDEVAAGKLTREQFAQQVQTRGFDSARTSQ